MSTPDFEYHPPLSPSERFCASGAFLSFPPPSQMAPFHLAHCWAANHLNERFGENAFVRGLLALKARGPGTMTLTPEECAPWEEAALVGGLLLGSRSVFDAIMALPDEEFPFAAGFSNTALGKMFDVLTDTFEQLYDDGYDLYDDEIQDALDRAGLFGAGLLEIDAPLIDAIRKCAAPVFDAISTTARPEGVRCCALAIRAARLARIEARQAVKTATEEGDSE